MITLKTIKTFIASRYLAIVDYFKQKSRDKVWAAHFDAGLAQFTVEEQAWAKVILESQIAYTKHSASCCSWESNTTFTKLQLLYFDIVVEVLKNLRPLWNIVGVQPMQGPVGLVYTMRYKYDEAQQQVPGVGREVRLEIISQAIQARTCRLQAKWTVEAASDMQRFHNMESEIVHAVGVEIATEIISEILNDLLVLAGSTESFPIKDVFTSSEPLYMGDCTAELAVKINQVCNDIAVKTRRGPGNFVVMPPLALSILQSTQSSTFVPAPKGQLGGSMMCGLQLVGTLNDVTKVYCGMFINDILVGYKGGSSVTDTGYVYCPYVMLIPSGVVMDPMTFQPCVNLMTRYGKAIFEKGDNTLSSSSDYYAKIQLDSLDLTDPVDQLEVLEDHTNAAS